jgi:hypothetical protein
MFSSSAQTAGGLNRQNHPRVGCPERNSEVQGVVARRPSSSPAAASMKAPVQIEAILAPRRCACRRTSSTSTAGSQALNQPSLPAARDLAAPAGPPAGRRGTRRQARQPRQCASLCSGLSIWAGGAADPTPRGRNPQMVALVAACAGDMTAGMGRHGPAFLRLSQPRRTADRRGCERYLPRQSGAESAMQPRRLAASPAAGKPAVPAGRLLPYCVPSTLRSRTPRVQRRRRCSLSRTEPAGAL